MYLCLSPGNVGLEQLLLLLQSGLQALLEQLLLLLQSGLQALLGRLRIVNLAKWDYLYRNYR